jgi:magnesium-transporting ATPase (P-type)
VVEKRWSEVKVGEIIKVEKNDEIPADILCISAPKDVVYISTMNLDGETNLKERTLPFKLQDDTLSSFSGGIICDKPNESLEYWDGNIHSNTIAGGVQNCGIKNTILRGCTLKNTDYVYGIVLYVGSDTKIMKNAKRSPRKISKLMIMMNYMLYTVFTF